LARAAYPDLTDPEIDALMMDSFLPSDHWAYTQPSTLYPFDPDQGRLLLEAAGWTVPLGGIYWFNSAGEPLVLQLTTTWSDLRYAWGAVFEQQMMDCGIWVIRFHTDPNWLFGEFTGLVRRNFEISGYYWDILDEPTPVDRYGCEHIPSSLNGWQGQNFMGWCNPDASAAAEIASDINLSHEERIPYFAILQEEFAQDMPSLPLFMRSEGTGWEHIDFNMFTPMSRIFMPVVIK
jgi:peptide/nickel transport system substrate-binding protein